jgi:phage tail sheath protein FI
VPPSGHIAGIYARVDTERGVHKAPANELVMGITGLSPEHQPLEQGQYNDRGINVIRIFKDAASASGALVPSAPSPTRRGSTSTSAACSS